MNTAALSKQRFSDSDLLRLGEQDLALLRRRALTDARSSNLESAHRHVRMADGGAACFTPPAGLQVLEPRAVEWPVFGMLSIGVMNSMGQLLHEYSIPTANSNPHGIAVGPDGNVWFVEWSAAANKIERTFSPPI
jgi:streptogramin lyase